MSANFEFNAPQFVNYSDDPDADRFFDVEHDNELKTSMKNLKTETKCVENSEIENNDPCPTTEKQLAVSDVERPPILRKVLNEIHNKRVQNGGEEKISDSTSKGNQENLLQAMEKLCISTEKQKNWKVSVKTPSVFEGIDIEKPSEKKHSMITRLDTRTKTPVLKLRSRSVIRKPLSLDSPVSGKDGILTETNQLQLGAIKRKGSPLNGKNKFVSLAERIQHFHYDTPDRFRSIPRKKESISQNTKPKQTIPKTPVLSARYRHRPINFPDQKEREELELKEIKKHQIKAHPLNEKILKGPVLNLKCPIEKKPATIPEPFHLTEVKRKEQPATPVFVFKAQRIPPTILNGPVGVPPKKSIQTTVPVTPKIKVPGRFTNDHIASGLKQVKVSANSEQSDLPKATKIQPFSFDQKIKDSLMKKEENIKKVIEEEKKCFSSFKALPLPAFLARGTISNCHRSAVLTSPSLAGRGFENTPKKVDSVFKAKPATVVHQKPFVPVLPKHELLVTEDFQLHTEKRALERQKFDEKIKKKEEELAQLIKEQKEKEEQLEKLKKLEDRKLTEFKAKPAPKHKPFEIVPADPSLLTLPRAPKCFQK